MDSGGKICRGLWGKRRKLIFDSFLFERVSKQIFLPVCFKKHKQKLLRKCLYIILILIA